MKKLFLKAFGLIYTSLMYCFPTATHAQNAQTHNLLIVQTRDGQLDYYAMGPDTKVLFEGSDITISGSDANTSYLKEYVFRFYFDDLSGIDTPKEDATGIDVRRLSRDQWSVGGQSLKTVAVYNIDGKLHFTASPKENNPVIVDLSAFGTGIYMIVINESQTLKIAR